MDGGDEMHIDSTINCSMGAQKMKQDNHKALESSNMDFSQTTKKVYLKTNDMLFSGGNGTGLSFYIKYAEESTTENPVVIAKGVDEKGIEFEKKININDIDLSSATYVELSALEAHNNINRGNRLTSLPPETGYMGLDDRCNLIASFQKVIQDMKKLSRFDLQMVYTNNMNAYLNLTREKKDIELV